MTTFKAWLLTRRVTDTPRGDFIRDVRDDKDFPDSVLWEIVDSYLYARCASWKAVLTGKRLFKEYKKAVDSVN